MLFKAIIKHRFHKPVEIEMCGEDMMYALYNIINEYPKHKILSIYYAN